MTDITVSQLLRNVGKAFGNKVHDIALALDTPLHAPKRSGRKDTRGPYKRMRVFHILHLSFWHPTL